MPAKASDMMMPAPEMTGPVTSTALMMDWRVEYLPINIFFEKTDNDIFSRKVLGVQATDPKLVDARKEENVIVQREACRIFFERK